MSEIAACPFCGDFDGEVGSTACPNIAKGGFKKAVYCNACFGEGPPCDTEDEAIAAWNQRAKAEAA
jgi:hypothetical protein